MITIPPSPLKDKPIRALAGNHWGVPAGNLGRIVSASYDILTITWDYPDLPLEVEDDDVYYKEHECFDEDMNFIELVDPLTSDTKILELALTRMTGALDSLITQCGKEGGPTRQELARARGSLPKGFVNSFQNIFK